MSNSRDGLDNGPSHPPFTPSSTPTPPRGSGSRKKSVVRYGCFGLIEQGGLAPMGGGGFCKLGGLEHNVSTVGDGDGFFCGTLRLRWRWAPKGWVLASVSVSASSSSGLFGLSLIQARSAQAQVCLAFILDGVFWLGFGWG